MALRRDRVTRLAGILRRCCWRRRYRRNAGRTAAADARSFGRHGRWRRWSPRRIRPRRCRYRAACSYSARRATRELAERQASSTRGEPGDARRSAGALGSFGGLGSYHVDKKSIRSRAEALNLTRWPRPRSHIRVRGRSTHGASGAIPATADNMRWTWQRVTAREPHAGQPPPRRLLAAHRREAHQRGDRRGAHRIAPRAERHRHTPSAMGSTFHRSTGSGSRVPRRPPGRRARPLGFVSYCSS